MKLLAQWHIQLFCYQHHQPTSSHFQNLMMRYMIAISQNIYISANFFRIFKAIVCNLQKEKKIASIIDNSLQTSLHLYKFKKRNRGKHAYDEVYSFNEADRF